MASKNFGHSATDAHKCPILGKKLRTESPLSTMAAFNNSFLKVCHVNCQLLCAHLDEFKIFFGFSDYHLIFLSETWLKPEMPDRMIELRGFSIFRRDRIGGGGSVWLFILEIYYEQPYLPTLRRLTVANLSTSLQK